MKITKSELKKMICEALREELDTRCIIIEGAYNGGQAEGGFLDTAKRPGLVVQRSQVKIIICLD